ncbi:MAG: DUF1015 family protein [Lachnospiraceae bacterium]|nr:DUF1015 family protein [Lachnospiraceae bacterium]
MSVIRPFNAIIPKRDILSKVSALPYDVFSSDEARAIADNNPLSFLRIDRPEINFDKGTDIYDPKVYVKAKEIFTKAIERGDFVKDENPCFYIYRLTMDGCVQTGLVALASAEEYLKGTIKKHENTRKDKEDDRIRHVDTLNAQTGPIFLAYKAQRAISDVIDSFIGKYSPFFDFTEDNVRNEGFRIDDPDDIKIISMLFEKVDRLYIADGHHRCESAAKVYLKRKESGKSVDDGFLSVIFPDEELKIMDYNRVVKSLNGMTEDELIEKVSGNFDVTLRDYNEDKPAKKGDIYMILKDREFLLRLKKDIVASGPVENLDVEILQKYLLEPIFGIKDPKTDKNIDFVGGIRGVSELIDRVKNGAGVSFAMHPTSMDELFNVADAGLLMPPKSTWFEPKLRSGIFMYEIS